MVMFPVKPEWFQVMLCGLPKAQDSPPFGEVTVKVACWAKPGRNKSKIPKTTAILFMAPSLFAFRLIQPARSSQAGRRS
jgi:hypothetical protein